MVMGMKGERRGDGEGGGHCSGERERQRGKGMAEEEEDGGRGRSRQGEGRGGRWREAQGAGWEGWRTTQGILTRENAGKEEVGGCKVAVAKSANNLALRPEAASSLI